MSQENFGLHSLDMVRDLLEKSSPTATERWLEPIPLTSRVAWLLKLNASQEYIRELYSLWESWKAS